VTEKDAGSDAPAPSLILDLDADGAKDASSGADRTAPVDAKPTQEAAEAPAFTAVPLVGCTPSEYTATTTVGGSQTFQFIVDTGSTTLGVASTMCPTCAVSPEYTPGASAVDEHKTASSQYGSGSWSGEVYEDSVSVGSSRTSSDTFVAIDTQSQFFQQGVRCGNAAGPQGILGLAPAANALPGTQGFFDALVANEGVPNIFATELCDTSGTLWLGGYDATFTTAAPQYTPLLLSNYGYYGVSLGSITVGGTSVPIASADYPYSVVDTGTSVFLLGTTAFTALTTAIGADAGFKQIFGFGGSATVDASTPDGGVADAAAVDSGNGASWFTNPENCMSLTQSKAELDAMLPSLTLVFGSGPSISVQAAPTESYLMQYDGLWCPALYSEAQGQDFPLASIMGSPLLRSNVVIFDRANTRIGFAPHTACP
jgi:hypothetical protein